MKISVKLWLNFRKRIRRSFICCRFICPIRMHHKPWTIVNVERLLTHWTFVDRVAFHGHKVIWLGYMWCTIAKTKNYTYVPWIASSFNAYRTLLWSKRRLVQVIHCNIRFIVSLFTVVLFEHKRLICVKSVPYTCRLLPIKTRRSSDKVIICRDCLI